MRTFAMSEARVLDAPPEIVYRVLADYREHHPRILPPSAFESLTVEKGGVGAGTVIRVAMRVLGTRRLLRMEVREPEPGRVLEEAELPSGALTRFTVAPAPGGRSRVEIATRWPRADGLRGWIESRTTPGIARRIYREELALLEKHAQGVASAAELAPSPPPASPREASR